MRILFQASQIETVQHQDGFSSADIVYGEQPYRGEKDYYVRVVHTPLAPSSYFNYELYYCDPRRRRGSVDPLLFSFDFFSMSVPEKIEIGDVDSDGDRDLWVKIFSQDGPEKGITWLFRNDGLTDKTPDFSPQKLPAISPLEPPMEQPPVSTVEVCEEWVSCNDDFAPRSNGEVLKTITLVSNGTDETYYILPPNSSFEYSIEGPKGIAIFARTFLNDRKALPSPTNLGEFPEDEDFTAAHIPFLVFYGDGVKVFSIRVTRSRKDETITDSQVTILDSARFNVPRGGKVIKLENKNSIPILVRVVCQKVYIECDKK